MTYEEWIKQHEKKHNAIMKKLTHLSIDEIIDYFDYDSMVKNEPDFCPLYKLNTKCHPMKNLNCYICACPFFQIEQHQSVCKIDSPKGSQIQGSDNFLHQDCSNCSVPHHKKFIKEHFDYNWKKMIL